jgi:hypothetical protein
VSGIGAAKLAATAEVARGARTDSALVHVSPSGGSAEVGDHVHVAVHDYVRISILVVGVDGDVDVDVVAPLGRARRG